MTGLVIRDHIYSLHPYIKGMKEFAVLDNCSTPVPPETRESILKGIHDLIGHQHQYYRCMLDEEETEDNEVTVLNAPGKVDTLTSLLQLILDILFEIRQEGKVSGIIT